MTYKPRNIREIIESILIRISIVTDIMKAEGVYTKDTTLDDMIAFSSEILGLAEMENLIYRNRFKEEGKLSGDRHEGYCNLSNNENQGEKLAKMDIGIDEDCD